MFHQLLLCTDGSEQALHAARVAADLACRRDAPIHLVNVLDPLFAAGPASFAPEAVFSAETTLKCAQDDQEAFLARAGQVLDQADIPYQSFAEYGHPVERIRHVAERTKADLIVMGSRGLGGWPSLLLGSISEGVVRDAPCPVLIVRGEPQGFHQIVIASDGSESAGRAVRAGLELAKDYGAEVDILNVFQPLASYPGVSRDILDPDLYVERVQEAIAGQAEGIARGMGVPYRIRQEQGSPAETLVGFAEMQHADLLVLGSRGLGGFKRLVLGSVCSSVLHHAHCSVLVVR